MRFFLLILMAISAAASAAPQDRPVKLPDGRVLNLWCDGRRGPVVLLDSGWSADSRAWGRVMAPLASEYRLCAQDRAGAGRSDRGPLPRDGAAVARDLADAAAAAGLPAPYIVVGHSLGALNVRHFALAYPERVAAMVLVDPSTPNQDARFAAAAGSGAGSVAPIISRSERCLAAVRAGPLPADDPALARCRTTPAERAEERWEARLSEIQSMNGSTSAGLASAGPGSMAAPVIVLVAGRNLPAQQGDGFMLDLHNESAAISRRGEVRVVRESGHMMMFDAPQAVVEAIRDARRMATAKNSPDGKK